jgi:hypothetical protein
MLLLCRAPSQSQVASPLRWPSCIQAGYTIQLAELDWHFSARKPKRKRWADSTTW